MGMLITLSFQKQPPREGEEWIKRTARTTGKEFRVTESVDQIIIPLDAYEQSALEIRYLPDTDEVCVLHHDNQLHLEPECVFSVKREEP